MLTQADFPDKQTFTAKLVDALSRGSSTA